MAEFPTYEQMAKNVAEKALDEYLINDKTLREWIKIIAEQESKTGHCKDCRWWRDSDGLYRRGSRAESKCPINRREVFEGNGYCYMFEAKMKSEEMI